MNNRCRFTRYFLVVLWFVLTVAAGAQDYPPKGFTKVYADNSPQNSFEIVHFKQNPDDFSSDSQVWLHALKPGFKTQLLFTHNNRAAWLVSADENFIAINHHAMSDLGLLHVFSRNKEGVFQEVKKDFYEATSKLMAEQLKLKPQPGFDHIYCYADAWLRDGYLLAHLEGHDSGVHFLDGWYFIYDVKHDDFIWDLSKVNTGAFQLVKPGKEE